VIDDVGERMLREVRAVFDAKGTDYRIVVSPLYDQRPLHPDDLMLLRRVFGAETVFDFSGANDITRDPHSYYEGSHYRPTIARRLMRAVYGPAPVRP
jgi:hypothetical protein